VVARRVVLSGKNLLSTVRAHKPFVSHLVELAREFAPCRSAPCRADDLELLRAGELSNRGFALQRLRAISARLVIERVEGVGLIGYPGHQPSLRAARDIDMPSFFRHAEYLIQSAAHRNRN
jgi:hypothetical protein